MRDCHFLQIAQRTEREWMKFTFRPLWLNGFAHAQLKIKAGGLQSQRRKEIGQFQVCLVRHAQEKGYILDVPQALNRMRKCSWVSAWKGFILRSAADRCKLFTRLETGCVVCDENAELSLQFFIFKEVHWQIILRTMPFSIHTWARWFVSQTQCSEASGAKSGLNDSDVCVHTNSSLGCCPENSRVRVDLWKGWAYIQAAPINFSILKKDLTTTVWHEKCHVWLVTNPWRIINWLCSFSHLCRAL